MACLTYFVLYVLTLQRDRYRLSRELKGMLDEIRSVESSIRDSLDMEPGESTPVPKKPSPRLIIAKKQLRERGESSASVYFDEDDVLALAAGPPRKKGSYRSQTSGTSAMTTRSSMNGDLMVEPVDSSVLQALAEGGPTSSFSGSSTMKAKKKAPSRK